MAPAILEVRRLGKRYPDARSAPALPVIRDLSFSVAAGECLAILGPSGIGKTTLLNVLAQVETATSGEVWFESRMVPLTRHDELSPGLCCRIGYVSQDDHLLPWRTVLQNVLFPLQVQRRLTAASRQHAEALIRSAGLAGFEHHYPHELSGGMRKRVSLIRTLVYDPPVILMDEPFAALDPETKTLLQQNLVAWTARSGTTVVLVTHDITEAIALADRLLILSGRPMSVQAEHRVEAPRPRTVRDVAAADWFAGMYRLIRAEMRAASCAG